MICSRLTLIVPYTPTVRRSSKHLLKFHVHAGLKQLQKKEKNPNPNPNHIVEKKRTLQLTLLGRSLLDMTVDPMAKNGASAPLILTSGASGLINAIFSRGGLSSLLILMNAFVMILVAPSRGRSRRQCISAAPGIVTSEKTKDEKKQGSSGGRKGAMVRLPVTVVPWRSTVTVDQDVAARRAIAIRRVIEDSDEETARDFTLFTTSRGDTMFTQSWTPISIKTRGVVIIMHGLNEHSGRYNDFAKLLNASGYKVYGMDWIGHGGSDGLHAYVHSLDHAVTDMKTFLQKVVAENPGLPCFCFGHSTGGAIVLKAVLDPDVEACMAGVVVTSPAVGVQPSHPIFLVLAPVFSILLPRYQVSAANKEDIVVSRDPEALVAKYSDPLVYTGAIRVRTGYEILRITTYLQQNLSRVRVPFIVLHGAADRLTDPEASQKLYENASSVDKSLKLFEGLLHDLLIEPEREDIMKEIVEWLDVRLTG